ncbi:MAG: putative transposase [Candidatus Promineifilaceae bacterium]|jgi:putative transposase
MQLSLKRQLVLDALEMALQRRKPQQPLLHHSDRGSQYASGDYQTLLDQHNIDPSMSRRGNCYDNAPVESFFDSLKKECVRAKVYPSRYEAQVALFDYIEVFYNRQRLHSSLGYCSPVEFEQLATFS